MLLDDVGHAERGGDPGDRRVGDGGILGCHDVLGGQLLANEGANVDPGARGNDTSQGKGDTNSDHQFREEP